MFRRKSVSKGAKERGSARAKKAVKRLLERPTPERIAEIAELASRENLQPFRASLGSGVGDVGACAAVANVMEMFPEDSYIQKEGCRAVEALADGDERNVQRLGQANCCKLVEKALERFPTDATLQMQGCRAVTNLFNGEANIKQFGEGKACELVTAALRNFPRDHEVQIEACGAVANLANNIKENRIRLGCAGACELVTVTMGMFPSNIDVQHAACVAVGNLANRHAENKRRLGAAGACNKVCTALANFQKDPGVLYMGCGAVGNLSHSNPQNCTKLGEAGGCQLVTIGMNTFPGDRNLQHVGCAAVANLAIGNAMNAARLVKAGARLAVQRAMEIFKEDVEIQARGSQALQWLTIRPNPRSSHSQRHLMRPAEDDSDQLAKPSKPGSGHRRATSVPGVRSNARESDDLDHSDTENSSDGNGRGDDADISGNFDDDDDEEDDDEEDKAERGKKYEMDSTSAGPYDSESDSSDDDSEGSSEDYSGMSSADSVDRSSMRARVGPSSKSASSPPQSSIPAPSSRPGSTSTSPSTSTSTKMPTMTVSPPGPTAISSAKPSVTSTSMPSSVVISVSTSTSTKASTSTSTSVTNPTSTSSQSKSSRRPSKAELPMGPLLEDFDSDGNGDYGVPENGTTASVPAGSRDTADVGAGRPSTEGASTRTVKSAEMAGGGKVAVRPSPPSVQAPKPGFITSGGDPAAPQDKKLLKAEEVSVVSRVEASSGPPRPDLAKKHLPKDDGNRYRAAAGGDPAKRAQGETDPTRGMAGINPAPTAAAIYDGNLNRREDEVQQRAHEHGSYAGHKRRGSTGSSVEIVVRAGKQGHDMSVLKEEELNGGEGGHQHRGRSGPEDARGHRRRGSISNVLVSAGTNRPGNGGDENSQSGASMVFQRHQQQFQEEQKIKLAQQQERERQRQQEQQWQQEQKMKLAQQQEKKREQQWQQEQRLKLAQQQEQKREQQWQQEQKLKLTQQQQQEREKIRSTSSKISYVSSGSGRSSRSGRRPRQTAKELLEEPAMASAPEVTELLQSFGEEVSVPLTTVIGRDPALFAGMLANVEKLLWRSSEMEGMLQKSRVEVMTSEVSPVSDSLRRREYFDSLYRGVCGAHIAAAVVANGGIMADSKDGWLRKASALVSLVSKACPTVRDGVGLLGRVLQMAERSKMADYLEQVAKASRTPSDVCKLMEKTGLRLLRKGRAEAGSDSATLAAFEFSENSSQEWLPMWLLEEAGLRNGGKSSHDFAVGHMFGGLPGTEGARKAAVVDGCCIIKTIGTRGLRNVATQEGRVNVLVADVLRNAGGDTMTSSGSFVHYPPASPSTLPPGQGVAPSPTGSGIGAVRRAEAKTKVKKAMTEEVQDVRGHFVKAVDDKGGKGFSREDVSKQSSSAAGVYNGRENGLGKSQGVSVKRGASRGPPPSRPSRREEEQNKAWKSGGATNHLETLSIIDQSGRVNESRVTPARRHRRSRSRSGSRSGGRSASGESPVYPAKIKERSSSRGTRGEHPTSSGRQLGEVDLDYDEGPSEIERLSAEVARPRPKEKQFSSTLESGGGHVASASPSVNRKSWGRTGSWYEPRKRPLSMSLSMPMSVVAGGDNGPDSGGGKKTTETGRSVGVPAVGNETNGTSGRYDVSVSEMYYDYDRKMIVQRGNRGVGDDPTGEEAMESAIAAATAAIAAATDGASPVNTAVMGSGESSAAMTNRNKGRDNETVKRDNETVANSFVGGNSAAAVDATACLPTRGSLHPLVMDNIPKASSTSKGSSGGNSIADRLASLVRAAVPGKSAPPRGFDRSGSGSVDADSRSTSSGRSRSSQIGRGSILRSRSRSRSRSIAPSREVSGRISSPSGEVQAVDSKDRGEGRQKRLMEREDTRSSTSKRGGGDGTGWSPSSSKFSTGSRITDFFSGSSKHARILEAAARDSFGSSDGSDTAEVQSGDSRKYETFSAPVDGTSVGSRQRGRSRSVGGMGKPGDMVIGRRYSPASTVSNSR